MKMLSIDSSSGTACAAVTDNGSLVGEFFINAGLTHSQTLVPMIDKLLKCSGISIGSIDAFAVTSGPGSFTGLRIGISAVKGIAITLNKPCIAVSSLYAMAFNVISEGDMVCSCIDARNGHVYNGIFEIVNGKVQRKEEDRVILISDLVSEIGKYGKRINFVGDGAEICYNTAKGILLNSNINLVPERFRYIKAAGVAMAAEELYSRGIYTDHKGLLPVYIRIPQAERQLKERQEKEKKEM